MVGGRGWLDKDFSFAFAALDGIASAKHVRDGCVGAVSRSWSFAVVAGVVSIAAESMTPAVIATWGWFGLVRGVLLVVLAGLLCSVSFLRDGLEC